MALAPGTRLGEYEIDAPLGHWKGGEVYRARDSRQSDVALHVLSHQFQADPERAQGIEEEARAAASLKHPNIVAIRDVGSHAGITYVAFELLEGTTLRDVLDRGALPVANAVEYALEMCHGLSAAHQQCIVHGDLRPENILITSDGRAGILGFGLARVTAEAARLPDVPAPQGGATAGVTPPGLSLDVAAYMAPERVRGQPVDPRSDIFSLGAILYEMLTGRRAFIGRALFEMLWGILHGEPPDPQSSAQRGVMPIVRRCLTKDPAARFQTALDVARALTEGIATVDAPAGPVTAEVLPHTEIGPFATVQHRILRRFWPAEPAAMMTGRAYENKSKLDVLVGAALGDISGKTVIDFGCGFGTEALDLARRGAESVIGVDIELDHLAIARFRAADAGLSHRIEFMPVADRPADVVLSLDAFEHFADPAAILDTMYKLLKPGGALVVSFGPTWCHPLGGHIVSVFPWAHLIFSEAALLRWREDLRGDRPRSFLEAGLNQMTIKRFERLIDASPFTVEFLELVPIRRVRRLHCRVTREFFTSIVRCRLRRPK